MYKLLTGLALAAALLLAAPAEAQPGLVQTPAQAIEQDAAAYARLRPVDQSEAVRRLRIQEASVTATDQIAATYADRLAGISFDHGPAFALVVLLTGDLPVPPQSIAAAGEQVPVLFRTGARATRAQITAAMRTHSTAARAIPSFAGMGLDQSSGELVLIVEDGDVNRAVVRARAETLTRMPVRVDLVTGAAANLEVTGGSRVEGISAQDGRRYWCTTGFVVTDGVRTGVVTAAHCPDALTHHDPAGNRTALEFAGGWGAGHQDVQLHLSPDPLPPLFYADTRRQSQRSPAASRARASTRAGEIVCMRGESSGYGCAPVLLTDFAPPGDLCGGPCTPTWVTVAGPLCRGGDSGGPVFTGTIAYGIIKGGQWSRAGRCLYYYYMPIDFLPDGWRIMRAEQAEAVQR